MFEWCFQLISSQLLFVGVEALEQVKELGGGATEHLSLWITAVVTAAPGVLTEGRLCVL